MRPICYKTLWAIHALSGPSAMKEAIAKRTGLATKTTEQSINGLLMRELVKSTIFPAGENRNRKYYSITDAGRRELASQESGRPIVPQPRRFEAKEKRQDVWNGTTFNPDDYGPKDVTTVANDSHWRELQEAVANHETTA